MSESTITQQDLLRKRPGRGMVATGLAGGAGLLAVAGLALAHAVPPGAAAASAALMAGGVGGLLYWLARGDAGPRRPPALVAEATFDPPYALMLETLPDPVMLAGADETTEAGGQGHAPRLLFANAAARERFRLTSQGGLLAAVLRQPLLLEALEEALYGRVAAEAVFEDGGALGRAWRVVARPLPSSEGPRLALVWMRDETDARRNERMRADFLANASHELRTPLASLAGFIETLRGHARDDPAARDRFLGIMAQQAGRMSRLIGDLLSLSRIELNEHIPPSGAVDLTVAATDVLDALAPLAQERGVKVELRPPAGKTVVTGDRDQIIQVIQNLVDNALKYASQGGGQVVVEIAGCVSAEQALSQRDPAAPRLSLLSPDRVDGERYGVIRVTDTGPGIDRQHLPRLSERFYRVEGQKSGERQGTGLGLAIVKHIVNRHRGGLWVESAAGKGSTFTACFPLARSDAGAGAASAMS